MTDSSRRDFLQATSTASLLAAAISPSTLDAAEEPKASGATAFGYQHSVVPLPFDAKSILAASFGTYDASTHPADTTPVLVMDMYEHAFHIDYDAAAAKYIDAFFANIQWDTVAKRMA